jgi:hypothetical protein
MTVETATWWSRHRFACISLAVSLAEILIMGGTLVLIQRSKLPPTPQMVRLVDTVWLVGGLGSFGFAVAALVADPDRRTAFFTLIVAIVVGLVCGFPLMVSA